MHRKRTRQAWLREPQGSDVASPGNRQAHDVPPDIPGYELLSPLGRGGMGVVHRAKRIADGTEVAIKIIQVSVYAQRP